MRPAIAAFVEGANRVVVEKVSAVGRVTYEIDAYRADGRTKMRI